MPYPVPLGVLEIEKDWCHVPIPCTDDLVSTVVGHDHDLSLDYGLERGKIRQSTGGTVIHPRFSTQEPGSTFSERCPLCIRDEVGRSLGADVEFQHPLKLYCRIFEVVTLVQLFPLVLGNGSNGLDPGNRYSLVHTRVVIICHCDHRAFQIGCIF